MAVKYSNGIKASDTEQIKIIPPIATSSMVGGIIAKTKTNEELEVAVDSTGKAFVGTVATSSSNGLMSKSDKAKLDGIAEGANNYSHPANHAASIITQDSTHRFVSDTQINTWNAKASTALATTSANGLMSKEDKAKLDGIAEGANNYVLPTATKSLGGVKTTSNVTSASGYTASPIIDGVVYYKDTNTTALGSMTGTLGIAHGGTGATTAAGALSNLGLTASASELNYAKGVTSSIQTQLNSKASTAIATTDANGLMSKTDKAKLDGIAEGANNYTHPATHAASIITQDATHRFVSDTQISTWNGKASTAVATTDANGLMSKSDKAKLDGIAEGANNYTLPTATSSVLGGVKIGSNITVSSGTISLSKTNVTSALGYTPPTTNTTYGVATTSANGLMSSTDKTKLDGIAEGANNYTHPTTSGNKHIPSGGSSGQILRWSADGTAVWGADNNTTYGVATTSSNGLMSSTDKTKLNGIAEGANNYTHPANHAASIITQDANNRFVTDTQISTWNAKASTAVATTSANGLMSKTDKAKLDGITKLTGFDIATSSVASNTDSYSSTYPYYYDYTTSVSTANHQPIISLSPSTYANNGAFAQADTQAGKIRFYFTEMPAGTIKVDHITLIKVA